MNRFGNTIAVFVLSLFAAGAVGPNDLTVAMNKMQTQGETATDELPLGDWGGEHISLQLTAQGGTVEFDCAHGTLSRKLVLDRNGRFDVPGTYVAEHGGPVRANERAKELQVRYTGSFKNGKLKLSITRSGTKRSLGTFTLAHGQEALLVKCR